MTGGISGIENVTGGAGDDTLIGDSQANVLIGGPGHDTLRGAAGDDALIATALAGAEVDGGPGVDALRVQGTSTDDTLQVFPAQVTLGTAPADVVAYTAVEGLTVEGLDGADTFMISSAQTADFEGGPGQIPSRSRTGRRGAAAWMAGPTWTRWITPPRPRPGR